MKFSSLKRIALISVLFIAGLFISLFFEEPCFAGTNFTVSPMYQKYSFAAGETKSFSFRVYNPIESSSNLEFELEAEPFFKDDDNNVQFSAKEDYSLIINWVTIPEASGTLKPGEGRDLSFSISVPSTAPAGGQYVAILVKTKGDTVGIVNQNFSMAHLLYADVAGQTRHSGLLENPGMKPLIFSGNISASITAKNSGNVHAYAYQRLTVTNLFGEKVYSSPDSDTDKLIMPETSRQISLEWSGTPSIGLFRAAYTVEFEDEVTTVEKIILVCPLWLLTLVFILLASAVIVIVKKLKNRHKTMDLAEV